MKHLRLVDGRRPPDVDEGVDYARVLGLRSADTTALIQRVREGFGYGVFERLREAMDIPAGDLATAVAIAPRTLHRRKEGMRFAPDESDRILRTARVYVLALALFEGSAGATREWLRTANAALGGATPLELLPTDLGVREVEGLIGRLEHGIPS